MPSSKAFSAKAWTPQLDHHLSSMASKPVAFLLADLGVTKSHSRPHTSNDNPYSEAQFKTLVRDQFIG